MDNKKISSSMLHLRLNNSLHNDVKKLAKSMGVSVSLIGEVLFKRFIEEKELNIGVSYTPNKNLKRVLDEAEENRDDAKHWTTCDSIDSLMTSLNK